MKRSQAFLTNEKDEEPVVIKFDSLQECPSAYSLQALGNGEVQAQRRALQESQSEPVLNRNRIRDIVDSKGVPKKWKLRQKGSRISISKLNKLKPENVRSFPSGAKPRYRGTLKERNFSSARIQQSLESIQDSDNRTTLKELVESLNDEDFLHLDQSKIPIEEFDDSSVERYEPEEWLRVSNRGRSPVYTNGVWQWLECDVLSYNPEQRKYEIYFPFSGKRKFVKRLNLVFDIENIDLFHERVKKCHELRERAKTMIRLEYFIQRQPSDGIMPLSEPIWKIIYVLATAKLARETIENHRIKNVLEDLMEEVDRKYIDAMKSAILKVTLQNSKQLQKRFKSLKLHDFSTLVMVPEFGKIQNKQDPEVFIANKRNIARIHISSTMGVIKTISWLEDSWRTIFGSMHFVDISLDNLIPTVRTDQRRKLRLRNISRDSENKLPISISSFKAIQNKQSVRVLEKLQTSWRKGVIGWLFDNLGTEYNFFETNWKKVLESPTIPLLKRFNLLMSDQLKDIIHRTAVTWEEFIVNHSISGSKAKSIVTVELLLGENGSILISPSEEEIISCFTEVFVYMERAVNEIMTIDHEILTLHKIEPKILLQGTKEIQLQLQSIIDSSKCTIESAIRSSCTKIKDVAKKYDAICSNMSLNPARYIKVFAKKIKEMQEDSDVEEEETFKPIEVYRIEMEKFWKLTSEIFEITATDEPTGLVSVGCSKLQTALNDRAESYLNAFTSDILSTQRELSNLITEEYEIILKKISVKPKDELQLVEIEQFVEESKIEMSSLQYRQDDVHDWLSLLEEFQRKIDPLDFNLMWGLKLWPKRIKSAENQTRRTLETTKSRMIKTLEKEKGQFVMNVDIYAAQVEAFKLHIDYTNLSEIVSEAFEINENLEEALEQVKDFHKREGAFRFELEEYPLLSEAVKSFSPFFKVWTMSADFINKTQEWLTGPFKSLDGDIVEKDVNEWWTTSYRLMKMFGDEHKGAGAIATKLREDATLFKEYVPLIRSLASPALRRRHWLSLSEVLEEEITVDNSLNLQSLLDMSIMSHWEEVEVITVKAEKEFSLEKAIEAMKSEWVGLNFECLPYKETGTYVIKATDDILAMLDDQIVKVQTMLGSPFIKPIIHLGRECEKRLQLAQMLIDELLKCQRSWMYLEPIFKSEDILRQMPTEARRFADVDSVWRLVLGSIADNPSVLEVTQDDKVIVRFVKANEKLDLIQKGLNDYLEIKRMAFARFFFLSNDELLEIISQTKDPQAVQPYLCKCFEGIGSVVFGKDMPKTPPSAQGNAKTFISQGPNDLRIPRMKSNEGEVVDLEIIVDPNAGANRGNVELWLGEVELSMRITVKTILQRAADNYPKVGENLQSNAERKSWVLSWPGQIVLNASQLYWTEEVTLAIKQGQLKKYLGTLNSQLLQIVHLVRGKLSKMERTTLGALCVIDVHQRDVVQEMTEINVQITDAFEWLSQLRYYWEEHPDDFNRYGKNPWNLIVRILNAKQMYAYEYLGNSSRLVITPLTDRCYRTLMGAVSLLYGGAPAGPAGTGKTETTKDLAKAIAKQCVVFNCSDGLDYLAMAKFFKGLAQSGAWACFDEFNRIELEVLSVIAQQILTIVNAKRQKAKRFDFEGSTLTLNPDANCFITMNPGYAGRQELPDNLQALFRPCSMMVPDYALIAEIKLFAFGFEDARAMAQKLTQVLILCSEQLSSQKHYDYGMRAVFSILIRAGELRQRLGHQWTEPMLVLSAITDVNLPKFNTNDIPLFKGITSDLFPGVELPVPDYGNLIPAIKHVCEMDNLQPEPSFIRAVVQLYETVMVRHGLMVVGQTYSGKTCVTHTLAKAMSTIENDPNFDNKVEIHTINPKSITQGQLYGNFDENTHEWTDGILAVTYRSCSKDTSGNRQWLMFDGPVDAIWIEDMNTVLDDNKKLCLQSGEIVKMSPLMTMMFEPEDLEVASPATVSRVGMVFLEQKRLGWRPLVKSWVATLPVFLSERGIHKEVIQLFDCYFEPTVFHVRKTCDIHTPVTDSELCASIIRIMQSFLFEHFIESDQNSTAYKYPFRATEGSFLIALVWGVGAITDNRGRRLFDTFIKRLLTGTLGENASWVSFLAKNPSYNHKEVRELRMSMPFEKGSTFDYCFDTNNCVWVPWLDQKPDFFPDNKTKFQNILVPTVDSVRNSFIVKKLVENGMPVLCTGETGTGKTVCLQRLLTEEFDRDSYTSLTLNFSAQTSANQTQDIIDAKLEKRRRGIFGPPIGKKCIIMIDDLNMPQKETYGAQPPIEILRQWMDHSGWYDRKDTTFRTLVDLQFVAAMGPPGGGRTRITQRYVRHFNLLNFVPFNSASLEVIYNTIMTWFTKPFSGSIKQLASSIVTATINVYVKIQEAMLPIPAKSHYTFNLRDLSKVFQGICMGDPSRITEAEHIIRLWGHENTRVFEDRLVSEEDRNWFRKTLAETVRNVFEKNWEDIVSPDRPLIYGNFIDPTCLLENRVYDEISDMKQLQDVMNSYLEDFNNTSKKRMNLVLFLNAIEHVARIVRVINQPYGNALLVGVGGSGRKSLTTLAVFLSEQVLFQIEISKQYGINEWREDLKKLLMLAGVEGKQMVFLFSDVQVVNEGFVEDINNILNTGEVPNIFNAEEQQVILQECQIQAEKESLELYSPSEIHGYFVKRCRDNLHVVLAFSPIGDTFRNRLRRFPSLVNCCAIVWYTEWPKDALRSVATYFLSEGSLGLKDLDSIVDVCVDMQQRTALTTKRFFDEMRRYYYVTPTSYLELINTFKAIITLKREEIVSSRTRYQNGLAKLKETAKQVADMRLELEAMQPKLIEAQKDAAKSLKIVQGKRKEADETKAVVQKDEALAQAQAASCEKDKQECQNILAAAIPTLEAAVRALKTLSKSDLVEIKSMKKPPDGVKLTMEAVCIMMKVKPKKIPDPSGRGKIDDYWEPSQKQLLGDVKFLNRLMEYDKDNINPNIMNKITKYVENPSFNPETVIKASVAAAGLCKWVHAMMKYDRVAKLVAPKREALSKANSDLQDAMEKLRKKQLELEVVLRNLDKLTQKLNKTLDHKAALEQEVADCATKLDRASRLIDGLSGERIRWTQFVADLDKLLQNAIGDVILSSGVVAYLGVFTKAYRDDCIKEWIALLERKKIPVTSPFSLISTLGDPVLIREWAICKLPNDDFSIDNAIMLFASNRWPLMIDPQGQANKWVRKVETKNDIRIVKQSQNDFVRTIENSISFGYPVLLENLPESIDPVLEPVLTKAITTRGGTCTIQLGEDVIDYDTRFRLYMTTRLANPHYSPETCVKVNLLNFMATKEGLLDQMLGITVKQETPELEEQRELLVIQDSENRKVLKDIEDKILHMLSQAEGNILDDENLINTLSDSKLTSNHIMEQVTVAEKTQKKIEATRKGYISVAIRSSSLFFCVNDLASVDPMYQFSLEWYIKLFVLAIERASQGSTLDERLENLNDEFAKILYANVCRSLFEKDKLLFSFLLCIKCLQINNDIKTEELRYFLTGNTAVEKTIENPTKSQGSWLSDKSWSDFLGLEEKLPGAFSNFTQGIVEEGELRFWREVFNSLDPGKLIHEKYHDRYSDFQEMILLRCIRPDKVVAAVMKFISLKIGQHFIEPPAFDLLAGYNDSSSTTPLLFVLTPGADPMTELSRVASSLGKADKLFAVSLGQGQGPIAENAVSEAVDKGTWVCLQNCHVAASWLPELERICEELTPNRVHEDFRLWLTALPCKEFPVNILQNGIKITLEPPRGLRANLTGSYMSLDEDWFDSCPKPKEFKKLLFGICFFHALVRERCRFGALGWNIRYTFSVPDLRISLDQLMLFLTDYEEIPFKMLRYLAGECNYGGRVTDDKDRRCLLQILSDFYTPDILENGYEFSPSGIYYAPPEGTITHYLDYVKKLPLTETPEVFGLHENADITSAIQSTNLLLGTALSLQPRSTGGNGKSWAENLNELASDIEKKIPSLFDLEEAVIRYPVIFEESMNTVLVQELGRFNNMLMVVEKSLVDVQMAIKGLVVMSQELEELGNSMTNMIVPEMWSSISYPSLKPLGSWVNDLLKRISFFQIWLEKGKPIVYWISGFYFIPGFLTGTRQNYARKYTIPIDDLIYAFEVLTFEQGEKLSERPSDGAYISGLYLEGANWSSSKGNLIESTPKELYVSMPIIKLIPITTDKKMKDEHVYECPVYKTSARFGMLSTTGHSTNFVLFIDLPMSQTHSEKHWVKRGVAMLSATDD